MKLTFKEIKIIQLACDFGFINKENALKLINISKYNRLTCELCGKPMHRFTVDHIVPKSKGGSNELSNLRLTHERCNRVRGNKFKLKDLIRLLF